MTFYINRRSLTEIIILTFELLIFILSSSLTYIETLAVESSSEQITSSGTSEFRHKYSFDPESHDGLVTVWNFNEPGSSIYLQETITGQSKNENYIPTAFNPAYPYFPLIYSGIGVDHMNINLVNLAFTGLNVGDEVGVFDGNYCVGSSVIEAKNISQNSLSIPVSANENSETKPNGYIEGHKITIKIYRAGFVYLLYFETVNNSTDLFEIGGSMFALVDFSQSVKQTTPEGSGETIKVYPNPFVTNIRIEVNLPVAQQLNCEISDISGKLIKTLFNGITEGEQLFIWNGYDNNMNQVSTGIYFCRLNKSTFKIIYGK